MNTMNESYLEELRTLSSQEDSSRLWLRIATDIQIRRFDQIDDVPDFAQLSQQLQDDIRTELQSMTKGCKTLRSEEHLNSSYVLLCSNDSHKWIAMFQDDRPSTNMQALFGSTVVGGAVLTWNRLSHWLGTWSAENSDHSLPTDRSQRTETENNATPNTTSSVSTSSDLSSPIATSSGWKGWLSTRLSQYEKNIEACMLKKLEGFINAEKKE